MIGGFALVASTPTIGLLVGLPLALGFIASMLAVTTWAWVTAGEGWQGEDKRLAGWVTLVLAILVTAFTAFAMWPFKHDYHFWQDVSGQVERVDRRLVSVGEGSMEEKVVVVVDGQPYGVRDTRAALLKKGDHVDLRCKRAYQWASTHGWDCRWGGDR